MPGSVLEQEVVRKLSRLVASMRTHDRAVLLGFALSLLPIFPLALVGLGLGLFHRTMHHAGKINGFDYALARRGLWIGAFNSVLSVVILIGVVQFASSLNWQHLVEMVGGRIGDLINFFWGHARPVINRGGTTV